jgi:glycosyltransferase involved in cell wall biosynthesis
MSAAGCPLRIGVPRYLGKVSAASGMGKMWARVLPALSGLGVEVRFADPGGRRRGLLFWGEGARVGRGGVGRGGVGRGGLDAWLVDGHQGEVDAGGIPVVAQMHEAPWLEDWALYEVDQGFISYVRQRSDAGARQAARIIVPSEFSRRQVIEAHNIPPERVRAVPHGVDSALFSPVAAPAGRALVAERMAARSGSPASGRPYIAYVSVVHPRKNTTALRQATTLLAERGVDCALVMVAGVPPDRPDGPELLADAFADLPGYPGRVLGLTGLSEAEVAAVMAGASAFCLPSLAEGFGLPALEAMAAGVPLVTSNRGALPEVVGDAGVVVDPEPEKLADALEELLDDPERARTLGEAARQRALGFTWEATAKGWMSVIEQATREP